MSQRTLTNYDNAVAYGNGDAVVYTNHLAYANEVPCTGVNPTNTDNWRPLEQAEIDAYINDKAPGRWCGPALAGFEYQRNDVVELPSGPDTLLLRATVDNPSDPTSDVSDWIQIASGAPGTYGNADVEALLLAGVPSIVNSGVREVSNADVTVLPADAGGTIAVTLTGADKVATLPNVASVPDGFAVRFFMDAVAGHTLTVSGDANINGAATNVLDTQYQSRTYQVINGLWRAF